MGYRNITSLMRVCRVSSQQITHLHNRPGQLSLALYRRKVWRGPDVHVREHRLIPQPLVCRLCLRRPP